MIVVVVEDNANSFDEKWTIDEFRTETDPNNEMRGIQDNLVITFCADELKKRVALSNLMIDFWIVLSISTIHS